MPDIRTIRVFIASPGDLAVERAAFKQVLEELNAGFGDALDIKFEPLGWEDALASTGRRSQEVINQEIDRCDVFILAMHCRWGQAAPDAQPYSSYTEEEFHRAFARWQKKRRGKPQAPEIFVFFKHIDAASMANPDAQLQKVLEFRKSLEESRQVLYHGFANEVEFKAEVDRHLRAFAKGELPKADAPRDKVLLPLAVIAEVQKEKAEKEQALARAKQSDQKAEIAVARAETFALEFAERASKAALDGRVEEARQDFAKATDGTANLRVLQLASEFHIRTGDLVTAEELLERSLALSGREALTVGTADALDNLGLIYRTRDELGLAEEMHRKALFVNEKINNEQGLAYSYGNLGQIYGMLDKLDQAEAMQRSALSIYLKLDQPEGLAGLAGIYCNLGLIYGRRREFKLAEQFFRAALEIDEKLENQEGISNHNGNLGLVYQEQGNWELAEVSFHKALVIDEKLGRLEGIANLNLYLGIVAQVRGEFERAKTLWGRARNLFVKIGMPHMIKLVTEKLNALPMLGAR